MGMSIVKKLVDAMGGVITVDSEEGKGSVFRIDLPMLLSRKGHRAQRR